MTEILVLDFTEDRSRELRSERRVTVRVNDVGPLVVEYVMIVNRGIPVWIAKVDSFTVMSGPFPKDVSISLGEVAALEQSWAEVATIIRDVDIVHGETVSLNVMQLFGLGERWNSAGSSLGTLTAKTAVSRLAWTYGVPEENVKIAIKF